VQGMGVWLSILLVDLVGRRPLLIWGSVGCAAGMLVVAIGVRLLTSWLVLLGMGLYMFAFSCSHAGIFWVVVSEIFSMSAKSAAVSGATATLFLVGTSPGQKILPSCGPWRVVVL
jgi:Sugar (and other) transporter